MSEKHQEESAVKAMERDPALDPTLDHLSRRTFLGRAGVGTAGVLGAMVPGCSNAQPDEGQQPRALDDTKIEKREVTFNSKAVADKPADMKGFLALPKGNKKRGSVLVIHEIFGLNDHIRDVAARLAQVGYTALAPNLFTREGDPPKVEGGNFQPVMQFVGKIPDKQIMGDLKAAAAYLRSLDASNKKVGLVGFSWGGRVSMLSSAAVAELDACVAYYGRITGNKSETQPANPLDVADSMKVPLLGHFGAEDGGIPVSDVEKLRDALKKRDAKAEFHVYEKAGHAFNNNTRESYRAEAAQLAWKRTLDWFQKYLS